METVKIALNALRVNKLRSGLTILGVVIGVSSVILLISIGLGLKNYILEQLEGLGADALFVVPGKLEIASGGGGGGGIPGAGIAASKFTFSHLNKLKREGKTIKEVMAYTENNGTIRYKGKEHITQIAGVGPEYEELRDQKIVLGSFFTNSQYDLAKRVAVLGKTVANDLFGQEEPIKKKVTIAGARFTVLGVLEEKGAFGNLDLDDQVFIPATTALRQFDMENIQSFWVKSKDADSVQISKEEIEKILGKNLNNDEFSVLDTKSVLSVVSRITGLITAALSGIAAISLVVGGIGIGNIVLVSVTERTREIGLRKAVGATPKDILYQFLVESIILSLAGGILGIVLGGGLSLFLNRFLKTSIALWSIVLSFGVSVLVGMAAGLGPALKAARQNPIDALRYE